MYPGMLREDKLVSGRRAALEGATLLWDLEQVILSEPWLTFL